MATDETTEDQSLQSAIAEFLDAQSAGHPIDRQELLKGYPEHASALAAFFANHDRITALAGPLAAAVGAAVAESSLPLAADPDDTLSPDELDRMPGFAIDAGRRSRLFGEYELLQELGRGGMGVVYRAYHTRLKRIVALKMIVASELASPDALSRFRLEAQAAAGLAHPGIVPIYEAGECQGLPYFSMALVDGISLADCIHQGPVPPLKAARWMRQIADAVAYAHSHGVIHRDLKPANILLAKAGSSVAPADAPPEEALMPQITDFGLAKRTGAASDLTATGQILGTPSYMPPEQAAGKLNEVGEPADIYALGAILYALLAGRPPFVANSPLEVLLMVLERDPLPLRQLQPQVPRELEAICLKCLEKNPADRYPSAAALVADLDRFLRREPPEARFGTPAQILRRWVRLQPVLAWHVIGIAAILILIQLVYLSRPHREVGYHLSLSGTLGLWLLACFGLASLMARQRWRLWAHYLWGAADAWFLTALLAQVVAPLGLLLSGYGLLICASGLSFRTKLVAFTAVVSMASSSVLMLLRPDVGAPWHYALVYESILAITGLAVGYQVWRLEVLRDYYQERRP
jgi:serine/threonine-protein kinase